MKMTKHVLSPSAPPLHHRWTVPLANPIAGGGDCMLPCITSENPDCLYIADGWGSKFPSMKLRRLSLATGETLATASVKNCVRALHFHPDRRHIYAASDKKILSLDAATLALLDKHDKKLLNYPGYLSSSDAHTLLTADHNQGWLFTYDLATRTGKRRRIATSCWLLEPISHPATVATAAADTPRPHYYADGKSGALLHYDPATGAHRTLWKAAPYGSIRFSEDRTLCVVQLATYVPHQQVPDFMQALPTTRIQIHCPADGTLLQSFDAPHLFEKLALAPDNKHLAVWNRRQFTLLDLATQKTVLTHTAPETQIILSAHPAQRVLLTTDITREKPSLHCYEEQPERDNPSIATKRRTTMNDNK
jgi:hypothetical protein